MSCGQKFFAKDAVYYALINFFFFSNQKSKIWRIGRYFNFNDLCITVCSTHKYCKYEKICILRNERY